jgi:hypothetical protein
MRPRDTCPVRDSARDRNANRATAHGASAARAAGMMKTPSAPCRRRRGPHAALPRVSRITLAAALLIGVRLAVADPPAARGPRIEVAFVLDATGSMGPYIDEARRRIKDIADGLATGTPRPELRFALVSFRDKGDEYVTRLDKLTAKIDEIKGALDRTKAAGGGDTPESVLEGLAVAIRQLDWSVTDGHVIKLIYLVGDAPAHHYDDSPREKDLAAEARHKGIVIHTIVCGNGARAVREGGGGGQGRVTRRGRRPHVRDQAGGAARPRPAPRRAGVHADRALARRRADVGAARPALYRAGADASRPR